MHSGIGILFAMSHSYKGVRRFVILGDRPLSQDNAAILARYSLIRIVTCSCCECMVLAVCATRLVISPHCCIFLSLATFSLKGAITLDWHRVREDLWLVATRMVGFHILSV